MILAVGYLLQALKIADIHVQIFTHMILICVYPYGTTLDETFDIFERVSLKESVDYFLESIYDVHRKVLSGKKKL